MEYVLGFYFSTDRERVALIRKKRGPKVVQGRLNGLGGKVEDSDDSNKAAMSREFLEEGGVAVKEWDCFGVLCFDGVLVHLFRARQPASWLADSAETAPRTTTDEEVSWYPVSDLPNDVVQNLHWLIPMALLGPEGLFASFANVKEG
jgi:8-oxo-dGTP diphosphatase